MPPYTYIIEYTGKKKRTSSRREATEIVNKLNNKQIAYTICRIDHINKKEEIITL